MSTRTAGLIVSIILTAAIAAQSQVPLTTNPFWQNTEGNVYSTGLIWRDCNNDGYVDAFLSNGNDMALARNSVYLSQFGTLPVDPSWRSTNAEYSGHCGVGDIDDNGYPDFVVANFLGQQRFGYANNSEMYSNFDGMLNSTADWKTDNLITSFSCALGDVDGDGDLDVAFATGEGYTPTYEPDFIYLNDGGSFQTAPWWQSSESTSAIDVTWGDVDNDGDLDLALCYDLRPTSVYFNTGGSIETTPSWQSDDTLSGNTLVFGDVDNDGWLDLVVAYNNQLGSGGWYRTYYNDGSGNLSTTPGWQSGDGGYGSALALYDYDNDGDDDLAAGRWFDRPRVYENTGGTFSAYPVWRANNSIVPEELAWIDIDGDGVEVMRETMTAEGDRKLFYVNRHPLQAIDSVLVDGVALTNPEFCFDLVPGWVSLATAPTDSITVFYQYSFKYDLTTANWDTYAMAYGNTNQPIVQFQADQTTGWAPLEVDFTDNTPGATDWWWDLGDGTTIGGESTAGHTYGAGGPYDVYLEVELPDGRHNRTRRNMIVVLADTLKLPDLRFVSSDTMKVPVELTNAHALSYFVIPVVYDGPADIQYVRFDTDSCRTEYFETVRLSGYSGTGKQLAFEFEASENGLAPSLSPGTGPVINLYFVYNDGIGTNVLDTTIVSSQVLQMNAGYALYQPAVEPGAIQVDVCGDMNGDAKLNLADISQLISLVYLGGDTPENPRVANVNGDLDRKVNLADISRLISRVYLDGSDLVCY